MLDEPTRAMSVTIDDTLVVDRAYTGRARVDGVPAGPARVRVAVGGGCERGSTSEREVIVTPGAISTIVLPGGEPSIGCALAIGLERIAFVIQYTAGFALIYTMLAHPLR